jgi:heme o synthase
MSVPLTSITTCSDAFSKDSGQALVADFVTLLKPGVLLLVVFTGLIGALLAPGQTHPYVLFVSVLSIALGAGGAAAFNMWYDRDIDLVMTRTKTRPIPAGRVAPSDALPAF